MDFTPSPAQAEICATITRLCARFVEVRRIEKMGWNIMSSGICAKA